MPILPSVMRSPSRESCRKPPGCEPDYSGHTLIVIKNLRQPRWEAPPSRKKGSGTPHQAGGASRGGRTPHRRACPERPAARLSARGSAALQPPGCIHTSCSVHTHLQRDVIHPPGTPDRQGDQISMPQRRLALSQPLFSSFSQRLSSKTL